MNTLKQLVLFTAVSILLSAASQAQSYSGGAGTNVDPYQIATKADLKYLSEHSGEWSKHFIQTANISFSSSDFQNGGDFYNSGNGFIPIGNNSTYFNGSYNGNKFSISNLFISRSSTDYVGFFGKCFGTISDLYLLSVNITGGNYVGAVCGSLWSTISGCYSSGTVSGVSYSGGVIGWLTNSAPVTECGTACSVTTSGGFAGGLIGRADGGSYFSNSYATGNVYAELAYAGGLIGFYENQSIYNNYSTGTVFSGSGYYGGITAGENGTFGTIIRTFWDTQTSGIGFSYGGTGRTTAQMKTQSTYTDSSWDFSTVWQMTGSNYPTLRRISISSIVAATGSITNVNTTSVTMNGTVTTSGDTSAVRFLYGTTSGTYTDSINATPDTVKASTATSVSAAVTGLTNGTKYFYKVIAQGKNAGHYISGMEGSFTTISTTWGSSVKFGDAAGQYAKAGGVATTAIDNVTLEAWVKWDGTVTGGVQGIVTNGYAGTDGYGLYLYTSGQIALLESALGWHYTSILPSVNSWDHIALVRNNGTWTVYKNGTALTFTYNDPYQTPITPYTNLFIGGDSIGYKFHGEIDEVRVSTVARYTSGFSVPQEAFIADGNTAGLYHFDEGTGSSVDDASSQNNGLTLFSSPTWLGSNNPNVMPLPVELTSFTVSAAQSTAELRWKTATEVDNHGFIIERKGRNAWSTVGFVEGNGTTNAPKEYSYVDRGVASGSYLYRLKQIDRDGKFEYSPVVEVSIDGAPAEFALEQNYPNPFNPTTAISYQLSTGGMTTLIVYDAIGREVATLVNEHKEAGRYSVQFDGTSLASGIYVARLSSGGNMQVRKLSLMK